MGLLRFQRVVQVGGGGGEGKTGKALPLIGLEEELLPLPPPLLLLLLM